MMTSTPVTTSKGTSVFEWVVSTSKIEHRRIWIFYAIVSSIHRWQNGTK
jgi:hypothetical protein